MTATTEKLKASSLSATTVELAPALTADRDARVTRANGTTAIEMDDAGEGEFWRATSEKEADELVRLGLVRDAR